MSTVGQISNGESGLSVRTKLNLVIDRTTVFDTAANFTSNNPTLNTGQLGIETDDLLTVPKFKIGDGVTAWNTLPYFITTALSSYVKKGTLTNNTILKGSGTDTATDSSITDDGTTVTVNSPAIITSDAGNNQIISIDNLKALVAHDVKILFNSPIYSFANMQANETVETGASKNLVSVAKGTAHNKDFGTTAGTVLEGDRITQTITNGVTDKSPSEDAVFDALALKLTAANNLSDLANPLTARNNLKTWDLYITSGNQSTTSATATNITDLVSPTLTANKLYVFEGHIYTSCSYTGGVKFQITIPTGATITACFDGSIGTNATFQSSLVLASATLTGFTFIQFNGSNIIKVKGQVLLGSTAGTIQFGFASGTAGQTSTVNQLGTHIKLTQLN